MFLVYLSVSLLSHTDKFNSNLDELLSMNAYDELGRLISKKTGGQDLSENSPFQKADYAYTVRGWLKGINDTGTLSKPGDPLDLFAFRINYDRVENTTGYEVKPLYNGNIAETFWRTASDNYLRSYDHAYDAMNRLTRSFYQKEGLATHSYNEDVQYDMNGNIKGLQRNGGRDGVVGQGIDVLTYTYDPQKPNMLRKVMDASLSPQGFRDDSDGITDPVDDYAYDGFGNMTSDQNKGITGISYNQFSLPTKILFGSESQKIEYLYTAGGKKVRKNISHWNYLETALVDYLDGFQYRDGRLQFFPTSEGYVRVADLGGIYAYSYVYNYTDHLGNIRLSYAMDPQSPNGLKILEENHYYPFGLKHTNYNSNVLVHREDAGALKIKDPDFPKPSAPILPYNYKYNGKEFQEEMGLNLYDYGARNYDPAIGRWMNIDPLAETSRRFSPYTYVLNNPIYFIDPDGMEAKYNWEEHDKGNKGIYIDNGKQVSWQEALADYGIYANDNSGVTPFSTTDLFALAASHGIIDKKEAGNAFERATLNYLNLPSNKELFESSERKAKTNGKYRNVQPDAVSDIRVISLFGEAINKDSHFHEVKAVTGWLNLNSGSSPFQMLGLIDAAANSTEGGIHGRAIVTLYTTSNTLISPELIKYANDKKVTLKWSVSYMNNGLLYFTPPTTLSYSAQRATIKFPIGLPPLQGVEIKF